MRVKGILLYLFLVIIAGSFGSEASASVELSQTHSPITILSDGDFPVYGFSGSGTVGDPYIIEDLEFDPDPSDEAQITIMNTNAFFKIRFCEFYYSGVSGTSGVLLYNVTNGVVEDCSFVSYDFAINLYNCEDCTIQNNIIDSYRGIQLQSSDSCSVISNSMNRVSYPVRVSGCTDIDVVSNNITQSQETGIQISVSDSCVIESNLISTVDSTAISIGNSDNGLCSSNYIDFDGYSYYYIDSAIEIYGSENWNIDHNIVEGESGGSISIDAGNYLNFLNNTLSMGIFLGDDPIHHYNFTDNTVNGKELLFLDSEADLYIHASYYGQLLFYDCTNVRISDAVTTKASTQLIMCTNCTIETSQLLDSNYDAIMITSSAGSNITECIIESPFDGISCSNSPETSITSCTIEAELNGIYISGSPNSRIIDVSITSEGNSIFLAGSDNSVIKDNILESTSSSSSSLYMTSSMCVIENNQMNRGVLIGYTMSFQYYLHEFRNNSIGSKELGYFFNSSDLNINGNLYGQIIVAFCSDIKIEGGSLGGIRTSLHLDNVENCNITDIQVTSSYYGIFCAEVTNLMLQNIVVESATYGMYLRWVNDCVLRSILVSGCSNGIEMFDCNDGYLTDSIIRRNSLGAYFYRSSYFNVTNSLFGYNTYTGLSLSDCYGFFIFQNRFVGEGQARDYRDYYQNYPANHFDDGESVGNSWSEYIGTGPFFIPGSTGSIDNWPILAEVSEPMLDHLNDITFSSARKVIVWNANDDNPFSYRVFLDGHIIYSGSWDGSSITIDLSSLTEGEYVLRIEVDDYDGHVSSWGIIVTILQNTLDFMLILIPAVTSAVAIIFVIVFMKLRSRKAGVG